MKNRFLTISTIALALLLAGTPGRAHADANSEPFSAKLAGTVTDGVINTQTNPDLHSYLYSLTATVNSARQNTVAGQIEFREALADSVNCPASKPVEYPVVEGGVTVFTDVLTQRQLFLTVGPGSYECDSTDFPTPPPSTCRAPSPEGRGNTPAPRVAGPGYSRGESCSPTWPATCSPASEEPSRAPSS